ncbi:hypothetical protein TDB9533_03910 [Thalassocella blandensis]|nr:hypothetical protein TDB9533_03910 [Thalassocella blandensis]
MKYFISILVCCLTYHFAYGCSVPPKAYFYTPKELVENSEGIFLAKVVSSTAIENEYAKHRPPNFSKVKFEILDALKSEVKGKTIEMKGFNLNGDKNFNFGNHELKEFWDQPMAGSGVAPGDCWAYGVYEVGTTYLLFTGVGHIKAFEPIKDKAKDKWLAKIRELTTGEN